MPKTGPKRIRDKGLPKRVYFRHRAYYYVTQSGAWIRLGKTESQMYEELSRLTRDSIRMHTMADLFDRYISDVLPDKAKRTREDYLDCIKNLRRAFGHMRPVEIKPRHIYAYMDARGRKAKIRANREKSVLSTVMSHAIRWGMIDANPCRDVRRFAEKPRDRDIEGWEFIAVREIAPVSIQAAMDLAYLTGLRQGDILDMTVPQLKADGIHCTHSKTGLKRIYTWTPALRKAIALARSRRPKNVVGIHVICTRDGSRYTRDGFKAIWQRVMRKAIDSGIINERFTFHDIRAMAAGESEHATDLLGHVDPKTTRRIYQRKPKKVSPIK